MTFALLRQPSGGRLKDLAAENLRLRTALHEIASGYRDVPVATTEPLFRLTRRRMMRVAKGALEGSS